MLKKELQREALSSNEWKVKKRESLRGDVWYPDTLRQSRQAGPHHLNSFGRLPLGASRWRAESPCRTVLLFVFNIVIFYYYQDFDLGDNKLFSQVYIKLAQLLLFLGLFCFVTCCVWRACRLSLSCRDIYHLNYPQHSNVPLCIFGFSWFGLIWRHSFCCWVQSLFYFIIFILCCRILCDWSDCLAMLTKCKQAHWRSQCHSLQGGRMCNLIWF